MASKRKENILIIFYPLYGVNDYKPSFSLTKEFDKVYLIGRNVSYHHENVIPIPDDAVKIFQQDYNFKDYNEDTRLQNQAHPYLSPFQRVLDPLREETPFQVYMCTAEKRLATRPIHLASLTKMKSFKNKHFMILEEYSDQEIERRIKMSNLLEKNESTPFFLFRDKQFLQDGLDMIKFHLKGGYHLEQNKNKVPGWCLSPNETWISVMISFFEIQRLSCDFRWHQELLNYALMRATLFFLSVHFFKKWLFKDEKSFEILENKLSRVYENNKHDPDLAYHEDEIPDFFLKEFFQDDVYKFRIWCNLHTWTFIEKTFFQDEKKEATKLLTWNSNKTFHNYGEMIAHFCPRHENLWIEKKDDSTVNLSNRNQKSMLKHFIDGSMSVTLKHLLARNTRSYPFAIPYVVKKGDLKSTKKYIVKPSNPYIGSGKNIEILTGAKVTEDFFNDNYIVQELVTNVDLLDERKYDIRHFALVMKRKDIFYVYSGNQGYARLAEQKYSATTSKTSVQLTNISLVEDRYDDLNDFIKPIDKKVISTLNAQITDIVLKEVLPTKLVNDSSFDYQMLLLGFDSLVCKNKKSFKLIEINDQPGLYYKKKDAENKVTTALFEDLVSTMIPNLFHDHDMEQDTSFFNFVTMFKGVKENKEAQDLNFEKPAYSLTRNVILKPTVKEHVKSLKKITDSYKDTFKSWDEKKLFLWIEKTGSKFNTIFHKDKIIGYYAIIPFKENVKHPLYPKIKNKDEKNDFYIEIYLSKDYVGKGVGNFIISREDFTGKNMFASIYNENKSSISFFKKQGFEPVLNNETITLMKK